MNRSFLLRSGTLLLIAPLAFAANCQGWVLERVIPMFTDTINTDHIALDLDGGILAYGRRKALGGEVKLFDRNTGGVGEWEQFHAFTSDQQGYGYSLDIFGDRLALGSKRGESLTDVMGAVEVYDLRPDASADQVVLRGRARSLDDVARDGYGHSVLMKGDTLFVGAVGRSHPSGSGAVHVHALTTSNMDQLPQVDLLQPAPEGFQLPVMQHFGASMVMLDDHLVISSPGSGYSSTMRCGALHSFGRGATGWEERDHWYDAAITVRFDTTYQSYYTTFDMNDLGSTGIQEQGGSVYAHWARFYGLGIFSSQMPTPPLAPGCDACGLRSFEVAANGDITPGVAWPELDTTNNRGYSAWTMDGELIAQNVFGDSGWETRIYRKPSWAGLELVASIPALDAAIDYNGPIRMHDRTFIRTAIRQEADPDQRSFSAEVYALDAFTGLNGTPSTQETMHVWPSPSNGAATVTFESPNERILTVISANGIVERRIHCAAGHSIHLTDMTPGLHLVRATSSSGGTSTFRLVVQ